MSTTTDTRHEQEREQPEQELVLGDLELTDERAGEVAGGRIDLESGTAAAISGIPGGCDEFGCGSNHNEVLAVTA